MTTSRVKYLSLGSTVLAFILLIVVCFLTSLYFKPFNRGFFCDDQSIQKPYVKEQAIPTHMLVVLLVVIIVVVLPLCELFAYYYWKSEGCRDEEPVTICGFNTRAWFKRLFLRLLVILIGALMCIILTDIGKLMVGRLRPHFLVVCKPDWSLFNCSSGFITADVCTGHAKEITEARKSFPSGHSSTAMYGATILALYLEFAVVTKNLMKSCLQLLIICLGFACAYTRISDYFHHWSDVLAGSFIGILVAFYTVFKLLELPKEEAALNQARLTSQVDLEPGIVNTEQKSYQSVDVSNHQF